MRIEAEQAHRRRQRADVEPKGRRCGEHAAQRRVACNRGGLFHRRRDDSQPHREQNHRRDPLQRTTELAPKDEQLGQQKRQRHGHDRGLAEQRRRVRQQASGIEPPAAAPCESKVEQHRRQRECARQHVLTLREPGHRRNLYRMNGEQAGAQPGRRTAQPDGARHGEDQYAVDGVQQHVGDKVAGRVWSPEPILEPKRGECERVVLRRLKREPNPPQAVRRGHVRVEPNVFAVVPKDVAVA